MSHAFIVDANLPAALAHMFVSKGYACGHIADLGGSQSTDASIWRLAYSQSATIVTKDKDFAAFVRSQPEGPRVIWIRLGNVRREKLIERMTAEIAKIIALLDGGERLIEIR